jgi:putative flippase GtrA
MWSIMGGMTFVLNDIWEFDDKETYLQRLVIVALHGPLTLVGWLLYIFGSILYNAIGNQEK